MRGPPITVTCDCGVAAPVAYGERWTCPSCGKTWNTAQIPREEYERLLQSIRHYRLLTIGPPLALAAVLIPLAILRGLQFALMLVVLVMAYGLFALPRIRGRATEVVRENITQWKLHPE